MILLDTNVILEAMASGVPIVATRVGDVAELLGAGERGRVVAPGDLDAAVAAARDLLDHPQTCASLTGRALDYIQSHHSPAALKDRLQQLYSRTLAA